MKSEINNLINYIILLVINFLLKFIEEEYTSYRDEVPRRIFGFEAGFRGELRFLDRTRLELVSFTN